MSNPPLSFRPTDDEYLFIEDNKINFTDFVRYSLQQKKLELQGKKEKSKQEERRALVNDLIIVFFGIMCFTLSYVVINLIVFIILNLVALFCIIGGFGLIIKEIQHGRKFYDSSA